ncbi:MAG: PilZ domain-containing protein [Pseudomonadales bacterium]|nr:PilZ domain-containing protein [Pseudomonadales bacterium]
MPRRESNASEISEQIISILQEKELLPADADQSSVDAINNQISNLLVRKGFPEGDVRTKAVTVLLSDIRGFSAIANSHAATDVVALLNRYFQRMGDIISQYGGRIDKLMGDSILVVFGLPEPKDDDVERALACAVEMQQAMSELNEYNQSVSMPDLFMGIGINSGEVVVGELGSDHYNEYTVIGDEVNLVSRIESHSLRGQILISERTYKLATDYTEVSSPNQIEVKGSTNAVNLYELFSTNRPKLLEVPRREERKSPRVTTSMPLVFQLLSGKIVQPEKYQGIVLDLSYNGMMISTEERLPVMSEVKMSLALELFGDKKTDVYARILKSEQNNDRYRSSMEMTNISREGQAAIKQYVDQLILAS